MAESRYRWDGAGWHAVGQREHWDPRDEAWSARRCWGCGTTLDHTATVWRMRVGDGGASYPLVPLCADCGPVAVNYARSWGLRPLPSPPEPCEHCGRPVVRTDGLRRTRIACSEYCRREAYNAERRVAEHGHVKTCERCGQQFTASRADARYCTGACRVAAHREARSRG